MLANPSSVHTVDGDRRTSVELAVESQVIQVPSEHGLGPTSEACGGALADACRDSDLGLLSAIARLTDIDVTGASDERDPSAIGLASATEKSSPTGSS